MAKCYGKGRGWGRVRGGNEGWVAKSTERGEAGAGCGASDTHILGSRTCPRARAASEPLRAGRVPLLRDLCGLGDRLFR